MDVLQAQQSLRQVAASVYRAAPKPFETVKVVYRALGGMASYDFFMTKDSGEPEKQIELSVKDDFNIGFRQLREASYKEDKGAWYTAVLTVNGGGKFRATYDYDTQPGFPIELVAGTYVEDMQLFPRDDEYQPQWLKDKLASAGEQS